MWHPALKDRTGPVYRQIAEALVADIRGGSLSPSERLPNHRDLAQTLQVTTGTISRAYSEVARQGLIVAGAGKGTYVRPKDAQRGRATQGIDFSFFRPAGDVFARELDHALIEMGRNHVSAELQDYQPDGGSSIHREAGAIWINHYSGMRCDADRVLVCGGTHHSLSSV